MVQRDIKNDGSSRNNPFLLIAHHRNSERFHSLLNVERFASGKLRDFNSTHRFAHGTLPRQQQAITYSRYTLPTLIFRLLIHRPIEFTLAFKRRVCQYFLQTWNLSIFSFRRPERMDMPLPGSVAPNRRNAFPPSPCPLDVR